MGVTRNPRGYQAGDPIDVLEDGAELGREVDPATNPNTIFQVVDLPGVPAARVKLYLQEQDRGPLAQSQDYIDRKNLLGYFDEVEEAGHRPLLRKRAHRIMTAGMSAQHRQNWNAPGKRVGQMTEVEFEGFIHDKRTGKKINRGTVPRG